MRNVILSCIYLCKSSSTCKVHLHYELASGVHSLNPCTLLQSLILINIPCSKVDEQNEEIKIKNKEIKELKKEIDKRPLPKDVEKTMEVFFYLVTCY